MLKILIHAHGFTTSTYTPMECLNIDFIDGKFPIRSALDKPLFKYMSNNLLTIQDNLLKASAKELFRTDSIHLITNPNPMDVARRDYMEYFVDKCQ